uniref:Uncharacterized protein n=1 Tax=Arundo donax TaxID=35708 RepID=A0A0A9EFF4_ARUDO
MEVAYSDASKIIFPLFFSHLLIKAPTSFWRAPSSMSAPNQLFFVTGRLPLRRLLEIDTSKVNNP